MLKLIMILSKSSKLSKIHPIEKSIFSLMPIIIMGFNKNFFIIIVNIIIFIFFHIKAQNNVKIIIKFTLEVAVFAAISSITFIFDYGLSYVLIIILKSINAGICLSYFALTTSIDDVLYCLSRNKVLRDICDITKSMERFLVLINDEYITMYNAMKLRGGFDSFSLKIRSTGKIAGLLLVNTMNRWKDIKEGLDCRCYRGYMPYLSKNFYFSKIRFLGICLYNIAFLMIILSI